MNPTVRIWFTSEDAHTHRLSLQPEVVAERYRTDSTATVRIDPATRYQSILGMGSSFDEASVYHLMRMSPDLRQRVLRDLVHPSEGMGWDLMRICFGTSDFTSSPWYSYDDLPPGETDPELTRFSIHRDIDLHIPEIIRQAMALNPELRIFASPWSPPGWMKTNGSMCGGSLLPEYEAAAARYYRLAVQAYHEQGIPIHAITLQNEPLHADRRYPTTRMEWDQQLRLLLAVRSEFDRAGLETEIWIFDHNFADAEVFPARILADPAGYAAADGVAFHDYEGDPAEMGALLQRYPDKPVYLTEHSTWGTRGIERILQYLRNGSRSYNAWVTCLDDSQQPNPGPHPCSPTFVTVSCEDPDRVSYIFEYWLLGQITRFVRRGAVRIGCDEGSARKLTFAAFENPGGELVFVAVNQTRRSQSCTLSWPGWQAAIDVPAKTVATLVISAA